MRSRRWRSPARSYKRPAQSATKPLDAHRRGRERPLSAALSRSPQAPSALTLDAALAGRIELVTSPLLLQEVAMVLARPRLRKYLSTEEALRFVADLAAQTTLLVDPPGPHRAFLLYSELRYIYRLPYSQASGASFADDPDLSERRWSGVTLLLPRVRYN